MLAFERQIPRILSVFFHALFFFIWVITGGVFVKKQKPAQQENGVLVNNKKQPRAGLLK